MALHWSNKTEEVRATIREWHVMHRSVGLIPTMGNLHEGHMSLVRYARAENDKVIVSIFVNPLQFCHGEDFAEYPRTEESDRNLCERENVDMVFIPTVEEMYPTGACTRVQVVGIEDPLCGRTRPGHFVGVATIVAKLFNVVLPHRAYFGMKDFQQARVIQQMVWDLNIPVELRACPIVREADGLAMSSRNAYLSPSERQQATILRRALDLAEYLVSHGRRDARWVRQEMITLLSSPPLARVDYVELVDPDTLKPMERIDGPTLAAVAVYIGKTRLIDNTLLLP